jgi:hypothetical protein
MNWETVNSGDRWIFGLVDGKSQWGNEEQFSILKYDTVDPLPTECLIVLSIHPTIRPSNNP